MTSSYFGTGGTFAYIFTDDVGGMAPDYEQAEPERVGKLDYLDRVDSIDHGTDKTYDDGVEEPGELVPDVVNTARHGRDPVSLQIDVPLDRRRWVVYQDLKKPGFRNPGPPEQPGAYIGQVVIVPAVPEPENTPE